MIVNYHAYAELDGCLGSLQRFLSDHVEVILVDNAGDTAEARRVSSAFAWVHWIHVETNPGFAAGVNRAAAAARGRYFLLLNPDCLVDADVARILSSWMDGHPTVGASGPLVRESDGSVQPSARQFPDVTTGFAGRTTWLSRLWPENRWTRRNLVTTAGDAGPIEVDWVTGACMMVRRDAFEAIGGMDEQFFLYWEDADLCFRLKQAGWLTVYNPAVAVTHLTGRSSDKSPQRSLRAFHESAYRYFRKHGGWVARGASPLVFMVLQLRLLLKLAGLRMERVTSPAKKT